MAKAKAKTQAPVTTETEAPALAEVDVKKLRADYPTKSAQIRYLANLWGHDPSKGINRCGPISKLLGIRYQHARNVLTTPLKRPVKA